MQKQTATRNNNRNVLPGKNGRMNVTKSNATKLHAPAPINTPSLRYESQAHDAPAPAPGRTGWSGKTASPRAPTPLKSPLNANAAPWVGKSPVHAHGPTGRWGDDAMEADLQQYPQYNSIAPTVWSAPTQWNGSMYAQTQLYHQQHWPADGRAIYDPAYQAPTSAWAAAPTVRILQRDATKPPRVTPAQIEAILSPRASSLRGPSPRASPKHVAFQGNGGSPAAKSRPSTPRQAQSPAAGALPLLTVSKSAHAAVGNQKLSRAQRKEQEEILAIFSDGDELPRDRIKKKTATRKQQAKSVTSPRAAVVPLSKAALKERDEILGVLSDGGDLPRDLKKTARKQKAASVASPRSLLSPRKATLSRAQRKEQEQILAIFSDGDELPRDRKKKTASRKQAIRNSGSSPRASLAPKKQLSKAQLKERDEILAIFSDGDDLPRDHIKKKKATRKQQPTAKHAVASPRAAQSPKKQQLTKAQKQEQTEILAIFSDGDDLPRDHIKKSRKQQAKAAASPRGAKLPAKAVASPRGAKQQLKAAISPRAATAPKKQQLTKAQKQEQAEILAIFSDGDDLPRDHIKKSRKQQAKAAASPRGAKQQAKAVASSRGATASKKQLSKAQLKEREEILAIFSDGDDLPRDHIKKPWKQQAKTLASPRSVKAKSLASPRALSVSKSQRLTKAQLKEREEIFAIFSDGDDLPRDHKKFTSRKPHAKSVASPRRAKSLANAALSPRISSSGKKQQLTKAQKQEQAEILAIFSDGGDLPRDHFKKFNKQQAKQQRKSALSPRLAKRQPSAAVLKERSEILAIFSDGDDLPRDHKKATSRKQQAKAVASPRGGSRQAKAVASPRGAKQLAKSVLSPRSAKKQPSSHVLKERDEILSICINGSDLPRDKKKSRKAATKPAAKHAAVSPRAATSHKKRQLTKAQQKEQAEILAIFSDGDDLPRDRKRSISRKQQAKAGASPRAAKQPAKAVSPRNATAPKKQLTKAQKQEQAEIFAIFSDGDELPRDRMKMKRKASAPAKLSQGNAKARNEQPAKRTTASPRAAQAPKKQLSKAQLKERDEILAIFS
ncbi:hypothetical protein ACHHYP_09931, partial [Achlya hypogyna]